MFIQRLAFLCYEIAQCSYSVMCLVNISGDTAAAILRQTLLGGSFVCLGRASHRTGACQTYVGKFCFLILGAEMLNYEGHVGPLEPKSHHYWCF